MPEFLLEILSEEIPARMQARAAHDLERRVSDALLAAGLMPEGVKAFATPRRLALVAAGLPLRQPDRKEEKKGPRVGAPEKAVEGFLKSAGVASLDQCEIREDKKGAYYVALVGEKGRDTAAVIAAAIPDIVRGFPWPKAMRWGDGDLRWVRPIRSILACFDGEVVALAIDGIEAGDRTNGHRFMGSNSIRVRSFEKYAVALKRAKVVLDAEERKAIVAGDAKTLCEAQGLELVADDGLLDEVAGLAEWPVAMMGSFDAKFLALPDEVLTATMRGNQKYFSVRDPNTGRLANKFVFVANLDSKDGGTAMRRGYERVLTARLSDAWYLYRKDLAEWAARPSTAEFLAPLERVTFFEGLGTLADKARRVSALAREIAPAIGADPQNAEDAAVLAKADLASGMVYEFPELQGIMGRYYLLERSEPLHRSAAAGTDHAASPFDRLRETVVKHDIADAVRDHYRPKAADDGPPTGPVSAAVALADRIDTLTALWAIGKKPTGSSDPFGLRRAALGAIAIILESKRRLHVRSLFRSVMQSIIPLLASFANKSEKEFLRLAERLGFAEDHGRRISAELLTKPHVADRQVNLGQFFAAQEADLLGFVHDRLKVYLRDKGHRHDQVEAVLARADGTSEDDLVLIVRKLEALEAFLRTDDGANLAIAYKRAANILKAEEKKDGAPARAHVEPKLLQVTEEWKLFQALVSAEDKAAKAAQGERFEEAMAALAGLRAPVDAFFDKVTVNDPDATLRANRLALLDRFRAAAAKAADLSKLEG
jgi:glycyl-tRNA synthetase beta chain